METTLPVVLLGLLCLKLISLCSGLNNERCYDAGVNRICYLRESTNDHNWNDSRQICDSIDASLPVILNIEEENTLENYLEYLKAGRVKITNVWTAGQRKLYDNWTWINGQIWNNYVPVQHRQHGTHVTLTGNQLLVPENPSNLSWYLCQYPDDECKNIVSNKIVLRKTCVEHNIMVETWYGARNRCLLKKGDLLEIPGLQDIRILKNYVEKLAFDISHVRYWIGLRKISWFWMSRFKEEPEQVTFTNWLNPLQYENPFNGELCIYFDASDDKWRTTDCNNALPVICQRRVGSVIAAVLLVCIGSIVITVVVTKRKFSATGRDASADRQYQGIEAMQTFSTPENTDYYEAIDLEDKCYKGIAYCSNDCNNESMTRYLDQRAEQNYETLGDTKDGTRKKLHMKRNAE